MSRIGRKPIIVPSGVSVSLNGRDFTAKGGKGTLGWQIPAGIEVTVEGERITIERARDDKQSRAYHGLTRAFMANMIEGVSNGFQKTLQIEGVGFRAALKGSKLELALGYSHPVAFEIPSGIEIQVESPTVIHVRGIDRQQVGQAAADIRKLRPPEPYKGKGIRYSTERIRRKAGKAGA